MIDQDTIFLLGQDKRLERIPHHLYESEGLLQELIDQYPELLVGEQIDPDDPPRWLMVQREAGIPDVEGGCDRWAIDHVLLDQHGRPTLVEVKRSTDTRIRREVVGQMLDYAANALKFWPPERIRELAASQYGGLEALETEIRGLLQDQEAGIEEYWQMVERKQKAGEMRLLFVADQIPRELRRIIEFLNEHMSRVEVLGVEIRQYERDGTRVLVPRVIGRTAQAEDRKAVSSSRKWSLEEVLACFTAEDPFDARAAVHRLVEAAQEWPGLTVEPGTGQTYGSLRFRLRIQGKAATALTVWCDQQGRPGGNLYFGTLQNSSAAFAEKEPRQRIAATIRDKIDPSFDCDAIDKYPSFSIDSENAIDGITLLLHEIMELSMRDASV